VVVFGVANNHPLVPFAVVTAIVIAACASSPCPPPSPPHTPLPPPTELLDPLDVAILGDLERASVTVDKHRSLPASFR
jgi:hypothetical protein